MQHWLYGAHQPQTEIWACATCFCVVFFPVQGFVPFFVSATAGTTVYGAFDPLIAISDICKKYNIWMHVDVSPKKS